MGLRHVSGCFPQNWIFLPWERWLKSTKSRLGGAILFLYGVKVVYNLLWQYLTENPGFFYWCCFWMFLYIWIFGTCEQAVLLVIELLNRSSPYVADQLLFLVLPQLKNIYILYIQNRTDPWSRYCIQYTILFFFLEPSCTMTKLSPMFALWLYELRFRFPPMYHRQFTPKIRRIFSVPPTATLDLAGNKPQGFHQPGFNANLAWTKSWKQQYTDLGSWSWDVMVLVTWRFFRFGGMMWGNLISPFPTEFEQPKLQLPSCSRRQSACIPETTSLKSAVRCWSDLPLRDLKCKKTCLLLTLI